MTRRLLIRFLLIFGLAAAIGGPAAGAESGTGADKNTKSIGMAVEFMDHAAAAFICRDKGWFEAAGLNVDSYEAYDTGMALASALARGDIEAAFICLVPAINACKNAGVPIKIVAGTHKHGYGLVARRSKVSCAADLEKPGIRLGCVREGGAADVLLRKMIDVYDLDKEAVLSNVQRMPPAKQLLSIQTGQLDAAMMPEQWASMAETGDCRMLLTSRDVWPQMQGSVLVAKDSLIKTRPEVVRKLTGLLEKTTAWINDNPRQAAVVVARQLQKIKGGLIEGVDARSPGAITPDVLQRSMSRLDYTTAVDPSEIQKTIDYMADLGYIKNAFAARKMLDLRFLETGQSETTE